MGEHDRQIAHIVVADADSLVDRLVAEKGYFQRVVARRNACETKIAEAVDRRRLTGLDDADQRAFQAALAVGRSDRSRNRAATGGHTALRGGNDECTAAGAHHAQARTGEDAFEGGLSRKAAANGRSAAIRHVLPVIDYIAARLFGNGGQRFAHRLGRQVEAVSSFRCGLGISCGADRGSPDGKHGSSK